MKMLLGCAAVAALLIPATQASAARDYVWGAGSSTVFPFATRVAEQYARKTFPAWKSGKTNLSGQTMQRLVELVPPYLEPEQRMELVKTLVKKHESGNRKPYKSVRVDIEAPGNAFAAYFSPSWTPFQRDRRRHFKLIVDAVSA